MMVGGKNSGKLHTMLGHSGQNIWRFYRINYSAFIGFLINQKVHVVVCQGWQKFDLHVEVLVQ